MKNCKREIKLILGSVGVTFLVCIIACLLVVPRMITSAEAKGSHESSASMERNNPYIKFIKVGDVVEFGDDMRTGNDEEQQALNWTVQKVEGVKAFLVLNDYIVEENGNNKDYLTSWDRTWANERFYRDWFSASGREYFIPSEDGIVPGGKAIAGDKVFVWDARDRDDGLREIKPAIWLLVA